MNAKLLNITLYCENCESPLTTLTPHNHLGCINRQCKEYGKQYKPPTIKLEPVKANETNF